MDEGTFWHIHDKVLKELNERKAKKVGKFGKGGSNPPYWIGYLCSGEGNPFAVKVVDAFLPIL